MPRGGGDLRAGRRRLLVAGAALVVLVGAVVSYAVVVPQSQPSLWPTPGSQPAAERPVGEPSGRSGPLVLALAGDVQVGRGVARKLEAKAGYRPWRDLEGALDDVDVLAVNLEGTITAEEVPFGHKTYRFRLDPTHAGRALALPIRPGAARIATLANNHALDFGPQGLLDTVDALDAHGWAHAGAGADAAAAHRPAVVTAAEGVRVGLVSATDHCSCARQSTWRATAHRPGVRHAALSLGRWESLVESVEALDEAVDVVVVSLHWGANYYREGQAPTWWMRALARRLVEAGADVVHGHSAHQVLPVEVVDGKHVLYGTGDLLHDYRRRPEVRNDLGFIARIRLDEDGTQHLELVPTRMRKRRVRVLEPGDADHAEVLRRAGYPGLDR